jgi:hypothetical protein
VKRENQKYSIVVIRLGIISERNQQKSRKSIIKEALAVD